MVQIRVAAEEAEEGRPSMADAEAADESAVSGEVPPALGDEGGVQEVGRLRGEAEEDLVEEVVVVQRIPHRRRRGEAAARHVPLDLLDGFPFFCRRGNDKKLPC
jgi:hypothetical protein